MRILKRILKIAVPLAVVAVAVFIGMHSTPQLAVRSCMFRQTALDFKHYWQPLTAFADDLTIKNSPESPTLYKVIKKESVGSGFYYVEKRGFLYFARPRYFMYG